jgi:peptidylprolyl isomerase
MSMRGAVLIVVVLVGAVLLGGCGAEKAGAGDAVVVHYTGRLDDGRVFDSSIGGEPLQFVIGGGALLPAFEKALVGMRAGEAKTITIPAEEAYGPRFEDLVFVLDREVLHEEAEIEEGDMLSLPMPNGMILSGIVVDISESSFTLDANPILAGEDLTFDIHLVKIVETA